MSEPAGLRAFLDARCAARGDAVFLWSRGRTWSYSDLAAITDGAAAAFARLGLHRGDRVALLMPNGPDPIFTWLALAKIGVVTAPIHPQLTVSEVRAALAYLEPKALVVDARLADRVPSPPLAARVIGSELNEILSSRDPLTGVEAPGSDDPSDILMTSGTTGRPKGVVQSQRTFVLTGEAFAHWLGLTGDDRLFTCLPLSHINARAYSTMGALAAGASLAIEERFSASRFWGWLADSAATECNTIGAMLQILMKAPPSEADRAHRIRLVYSAPALGQEAHLAFERRFGARLVIGYGLSESTFGFIHPLEGERRLDSMGKIRSHPDPRFGNEARLVAEGRDVAAGEIGELRLRNPATFSGYFRDEAATREILTPDGWLSTGDLALRDEEGWHTFVARVKEVIRRRGENIAPAEVEAALLSHPSVNEAAVVGVPSALGEDDVAAFIVLAPGAAVTEEELRAHAAARLAPFKVPSVWRFMDDLPRTSTQRVARHLLEQGDPRGVMRDTIRVLYAGGDPRDADLTRAHFRAEAPRFDLEIVETGSRCLEEIRRNPYDLLLLERRLPDMEGVEVVKSLRQAHVDLPILIVAGVGDEKDSVAALGPGACGFLVKHSGYLAQLPRAIENAIARFRIDRLNTEMEAFAFSVSHDLRAPLRAMAGFSQALLEDYGDRLEGPGQEYARRIAAAARHMDRLITDLLRYSRLGRERMAIEPVGFEAAMEEALVRLGDGISSAHAEVTVARPLPSVFAHRATLTLVIANLLSNAVKFVAAGTTPRVHVWAEERGGRARLWVEDNGIGIDPAHHGRIFNVFERLHGEESYPGTGIGLAIVRRGVERMAGRFGLESRPGAGSRFWIELPRGVTPG